MTDEWKYAQQDPSDRLARLQFFSVVQAHGGEEIEFRITVREYVTPNDPALLFFAQSDRQTNQRTAPFTPSGWGRTMLEALSECVRAIRRFPYEGER
jgi:hypothetical protein